MKDVVITGHDQPDQPVTENKRAVNWYDFNGSISKLIKS